MDAILQTIMENHSGRSWPRAALLKKGYMGNWTRLRKIASGGKEYLVELQQKEAEATGISSLKIGFNNVFGYYLEVTNSHKNKVPASVDTQANAGQCGAVYYPGTKGI